MMVNDADDVVDDEDDDDDDDDDDDEEEDEDDDRDEDDEDEDICQDLTWQRLVWAGGLEVC